MYTDPKAPYRATVPAFRLPRTALTILLALGLAACQSYPLGMSKEEWVRLTPEQQIAARHKQAELDRARAEERARRHAARQQQLALQAERERRRVAALYRSGRYGDVVECVFDGGLADFRPGWRAYAPAPFALVRGEGKYVDLRGADGKRGRFWTSLSPDGFSLSVCPREPHGRGTRGCVTVASRSRDFTYGVRRNVVLEDAFKGARLECAYRPVPGMRTVVIERDYYEIHRHIHRYHRPGRPPSRHVVVRRNDRHDRYDAPRRDRPAYDAKRDRPRKHDGFRDDGDRRREAVSRHPSRDDRHAPDMRREIERAVSQPPPPTERRSTSRDPDNKRVARDSPDPKRRGDVKGPKARGDVKGPKARGAPAAEGHGRSGAHPDDPSRQPPGHAKKDDDEDPWKGGKGPDRRRSGRDDKGPDWHQTR